MCSPPGRAMKGQGVGEKAAGRHSCREKEKGARSQIQKSPK